MPEDAQQLPDAAASGGLKIYTTIDLRKQAAGRARRSSTTSRRWPSRAAPGSPRPGWRRVDPSNGHILAIASSANYSQTKFDYPTQAHRQPGSSFKVFALMTLIHDYDGDPNQTYYNSQFLPAGWLSRGSDLVGPHRRGQLPGRHQHHQGDDPLRQHRVRPAGRRPRARTRSTQIAHAMGITSPLDGNPAEVIGGLRIGVTPLEMADAYATLANGGNHVPATIIDKVVFPDGSSHNFGDPAARPGVHRRRGVRGDAGAQAGRSPAAPAPPPTTAARRPARPVPPTTSRTPGSSATPRGCRPPSGSATRRATSRCPTASAARWRRRSGMTTCRAASDGYCGDFPPPTDPFHGTAVLRPLRGHRRLEHRCPAQHQRQLAQRRTGATGTGDGTGTNQHNNPTLYAAAAHRPRPAADGPGGGGGGGGGGTRRQAAALIGTEPPAAPARW